MHATTILTAFSALIVFAAAAPLAEPTHGYGYNCHDNCNYYYPRPYDTNYNRPRPVVSNHHGQCHCDRPSCTSNSNYHPSFTVIGGDNDNFVPNSHRFYDDDEYCNHHHHNNDYHHHNSDYHHGCRNGQHDNKNNYGCGCGGRHEQQSEYMNGENEHCDGFDVDKREVEGRKGIEAAAEAVGDQQSQQ